MPALIALGAEVVLRKGSGAPEPAARGLLPRLPQDRAAARRVRRADPRAAAAAGQQFRCYKISKRFDQDISALLGAFNIRLAKGRVADVRIAYGGMAAIPKRATECEQALRGQPWTEATVARGREALAGEFAPISDMRASAAYRLLAAQNLLTKFHLETSAPAVRRASSISR